MNSTAIEKLTTYYGYSYIIPSICLFGIICNLINLSVLTNNKLRESPYTYLTGLAFCDLLTLASSFTITFTRGVWFESYKSITLSYWLKVFERKFFLPTANVFSALSVIITVALTVERYVFIKSPMTANAYCSPRTARKVIVILFLLVFAFRLPMFSFWSIKLVEIKSTFLNQTSSHQTVVVYKQIKSIKNYEEFQKFYFIVSFFIFEIIPFFILLIFNINLILMVKNSNKEFLAMGKEFSLNGSYAEASDSLRQNHASSMRSTDSLELTSIRNLSIHSMKRNIRGRDSKHAHTKRKRDELKLTRTLISVIFLALLSEISSIITYDKITEFLIGKHFTNYMDSAYKLQVFVSNMIILTLHSLNFFLFCAFNQKYNYSLRQQYSRYFNKLCCKFKVEDHQFS